MKRKNAIVSILVAFVMLISVFAINVSEVDAASAGTYWIKVNTQASVVTVYKKSGSEYVPYRAMLCSAGKKGTETPTGTYKLGTKIGWCKLVGNVWGQYSMVIKGDYLFHSVPYNKKSKSSMNRTEFNNLGSPRSHGCVRMATMDVKWIWDNCPKGTKVTVYRSSDPGPLGKPTPIKMEKGWKWDPTDPDSKNPNFSMRMPKIYFDASKKNVVEYGSSYSLMSGVKAKNMNAFQDLTSAVKIHGIYKWDTNKEKYVQSEFSTKSPGKYKIRYKAYDKYCGGTGYESFEIVVKDKEINTVVEPDHTIAVNSEQAASIIKDIVTDDKSIKQLIDIRIKDIDKGTAKIYSNDIGLGFIFKNTGTYEVTINAVVNKPVNQKKAIKKIIRITE